MPVETGHTCHAWECETPCKPEHLMCAHHWSRVPVFMQKAVYNAYRPGQCKDMNVSRAWIVAAYTAICHVAMLEKKMSKKQAAKILAKRIELYEKEKRDDDRHDDPDNDLESDH